MFPIYTPGKHQKTKGYNKTIQSFKLTGLHYFWVPNAKKLDIAIIEIFE